ncbi:hypothetical protein [Gemmata obscuriglobus]|uniref:hypothetical protein n=1 Tax=Gemmata obscuriglobus TaxID=114 RepID=UPI001E4187C4|nr:hypothetical protein [Gemmata obscuriglobus]
MLPGTAEGSEPNPALHLTPPALLRRSAHPVMAVQVSLLFGRKRARMGNVRLRTVTYSDLSALRHEVAVVDGPQFQPPEFLVVRYFGSYRDGSEGTPDAKYILAASAAAREAWWSRCTVLDFRELVYRWGDNMAWVTQIGRDGVTKLQWPLAIVVGDGCRDALRSLLRDEYAGLCVESLDEAFTLCRVKAEEHERQLKQWRPRAEPGAAPDTAG